MPYALDQSLIHTPRPVPIEVQTDIGIAEFFQRYRDFFCNAVRKQQPELASVHLDPRRVPVVAHPHLAETESTEEVFGGLYGLKYLGRDSSSVGDPGRKTGERRFVPHGQAQAAGEFADFRFGKSCLNNRTPYGELKGRASARSMVAEIVGVRAVEHEGDAFPRR